MIYNIKYLNTERSLLYWECLKEIFIENSYAKEISSVFIYKDDSDFLFTFYLFTETGSNDEHKKFLEMIEPYIKIVDGYSTYHSSETTINIAVSRKEIENLENDFFNIFKSLTSIRKFNL